MNLIFILFFTLVGLFNSARGLVCWECENSFGHKECMRTGRAVQCRSNQKFCETELRHGGWGGKPWVKKSCLTKKACIDNYAQNARAAWALEGSQIQCNENFPSSVCRCCCSADLCNQNQTSCLVISKCSTIKAPSKGFMKCTLTKFQLMTSCRFNCKRGFALMGSDRTFCDAFGNWSNPTPTCQRKTCTPIKTPAHATQECSKGTKLYSRCRFSCNEGYKLVGQSNLQCIVDKDDDEYGVWGAMPPRCIPKQCPLLQLRNGTVRCSDRNFIGSTCKVQCHTNQGFELYPVNAPSRLKCQTDETWNYKLPCCTLPCPPYVLMDFVVILDSSSSVGEKNWQKMKNFVESFLKDFAIRDDAVNVAIFRYSSSVDSENQVYLNSYPNNKAELLTAFQKIPYRFSRGTNTGAALRYASEIVLKRGNRKQAKDVVLLITDGDSQDSVVVDAFRLRQQAVVFVLPIQDVAGSIDLNQILQITGYDESRILKEALDSGFDALDDQFANRISRLLCDRPCFN